MATFQTEKLRVFFAHLASSQYTVKELLSCFASLSVSSKRNLEVVKALKYEDKEDSLYQYVFLILPILTATLRGRNSITILYLRKLRSVK